LRPSASAATTGTSTRRGALYEEDRGNGTVVQVNTTDWQQFSLEIGAFIGGGVFEVHGVGSSQDYYQTFSAVAAGRATERLTFEQFIDTSHRGVNAQWSRPINKLTMIVGAISGTRMRYRTSTATRWSAASTRRAARSCPAAPRTSRPATRAPTSPSPTR
jgi:hypothetical protein